MKVYLSGPMSGLPYHNFPAFADAAAKLMMVGYEVVSPADMDELAGIKPDAEGKPLSPEKYAELLSRDLEIIEHDGIRGVVVLDGWEESPGAKREVALALDLGLKVMTLNTALSIERSQGARNEVRVVNESTGGAKGLKPQRFSLIPYRALGRVAEVYHFGTQKYAPFNWRKGYDWSLSIDAKQRHHAAFVEGEDLDPESGLPHPAHEVFHCLTLLTFMDEHPELDDRYGR